MKEARMSTKKNNSDYHTRLCRLVAKDVLSGTLGWNVPKCQYITVELHTASQEQPDVFGWNFWSSVLVEVKVSRADFLKDLRKPFRVKPEDGAGEFRYFCCPTGLIKEEELPAKWGLLYEFEGVVRLIKEAERQRFNFATERTIMTSVMRREGVKSEIYDYRQ